LDLADYDAATGALVVRRGKGRKGRLGYANNGVRHALAAWIGPRGTDSGALFWPVYKAGHARVARMTDQAVLYILRRRAEQAGIARFAHPPRHLLTRRSTCSLLPQSIDLVESRRRRGGCRSRG